MKKNPEYSRESFPNDVIPWWLKIPAAQFPISLSFFFFLLHRRLPQRNGRIPKSVRRPRITNNDMPKKGCRKRLKFRPRDVCSESGNDRFHPPATGAYRTGTNKCNFTDKAKVLILRFPLSYRGWFCWCWPRCCEVGEDEKGRYKCSWKRRWMHTVCL